MGSWFAEESKVKRSNNRECGSKIIQEAGLKFEAKNGGAHLVVMGASVTVDFWPGTGKYSVRGTGKYKRGVFNLLKEKGLKP